MKAQGHPAWTLVQVLGLMLYGPFWFPVGFTLFLLRIPWCYLQEQRKGWAAGSLLVLIVLVGVHSVTCWRMVEDEWGYSTLDLPFGLASFFILTGVGMMPFRLHRLRRLAPSS